MSTAGTPLDPHDKMRARDVSKVARGEQAPRPPHEFGTVSPPPPPSSTDYIDAKKSNQDENGAKVATTDYQTRHCYVKYVEYHRLQNGIRREEKDSFLMRYRLDCIIFYFEKNW
ncbi:putative cytochrome c oxidase subunit 6b-like isoform X2 [Arachis hypogaea]|uniref:putative cytochrome c oxidase subunit 6b-like isoform X2 n=1 Tax=Arachis hypogaea TaxID=3818 RepID=UPI000DEC7A12|nr:putative cytochrome c oxidase subunit 6b-like isoform X2 [Arachis hypogaea]XP_025698445.1 putative cytochrome c oxidase subunit 6b-like isoform X2 [Arachis hypogaea]QHO40482.1 Putative cytochrome c oxidase subunit 6b-like [Arachis hypogaea]